MSAKKCSLLACGETGVLRLWTVDGQFCNWFCLAHGMEYRALGYRDRDPREEKE